MSDVMLGKLIEGRAERDAIHQAVAPVVSYDECLSPGQHIGFIRKGDNSLVSGLAEVLIGIVDPYLTEDVYHGDKFYMCLYPHTVQSIKHNWTHPAFTEPDGSASLSELWLRQFAVDVCLTYEELIKAANDFIENDERYCLGFETPERVWDDNDEFWEHFEIATGKSVLDGQRGTFFRCAC